MTTANKRLPWLCGVFVWVIAATAQANVAHNSETIDHYTVNFTVFNSLFIPPEVASVHALVRAKNQALVNVSVLDNNTGKTVAAEIHGIARNLLQQSKSLEFKTIDEPDAVYYIASVRHTNEEVMHFELEVTLEGQPHSVKFTRKLWLEP